MLISRICSVFCATLYSRATYLSPHQFFTVRYRFDENKRHWSIDRQARQPKIYNTHCPYIECERDAQCYIAAVEILSPPLGMF